ncbi:helix-turn-helix domain-containing protein [Alterisphingorhabdus coralli]|uniref:Helix-turn-helix domain-containing protein n=1 Tax=Alterisphingorhabdus coralli TaxID=3071408 RepID=A0AA97F902_9SPHN|nr:helix-turn-helix domain-containing protein [Parasphingorhabdus sp. SCSIO 66989]WOE76361.1 helix-turn-helix domain-containing protein [Parasphingorhabdus sp. SCSIO 66989]
MTGKDMAAFMAHMRWTKAKTARELGITRASLDKYLIDGAPKTLALACSALAFGLPAWTDGKAIIG